MLLAGTLREYPFSLLLEIFLHRTETGLLEISSSNESGYFYIKNGKVKDGQIGKNKGLAAINVVREFKDGSFRFRPLEPADYARVVWQRRFGPTGLAIGERERSAPVIANQISQFVFVVGRFLAQKTVAYANAAFAFWKRAKVGTKARRVLDKALAPRPNMSRRSHRVAPAYSRGLSFHAPSPTINRRAAIAAALQQGIDHNVIFAITLTALLSVGGLCVYQLVFGDQHPIDTRISIDQNFDTSAQAKPTKPKTKRSGNKRRSTGRVREQKVPIAPN
jgi:hypothetical protein